MEPEVGGPLFWWDPSRWEPETVWHRVLGPWAGVWSGLLGVTIVVVAWRSSRLAPAVDAADLTDQRRLAPYVQLALTNMLVAVGQFSLYAAFAVDFGVTAQVLLSAGVSVVIAAVALLLPLRGVRGRVVTVKRAELAWCDEELRRARAAVRAGADAVAPGRLADLAAYRNAVDGASDWGFDSPALRRVALYLLIPVGSWVASTLVQHALERYVLGG
jgi:hypothetical protein